MFHFTRFSLLAPEMFFWIVAASGKKKCALKDILKLKDNSANEPFRNYLKGVAALLSTGRKKGARIEGRLHNVSFFCFVRKCFGNKIGKNEQDDDEAKHK